MNNTATHCNSLQHTGTHCSILQQIANHQPQKPSTTQTQFVNRHLAARFHQYRPHFWVISIYVVYSFFIHVCIQYLRTALLNSLYTKNIDITFELCLYISYLSIFIALRWTYYSFHWKCYNLEIHQIQKLKFLGTKKLVSPESLYFPNFFWNRTSLRFEIGFTLMSDSIVFRVRSWPKWLAWYHPFKSAISLWIPKPEFNLQNKSGAPEFTLQHNSESPEYCDMGKYGFRLAPAGPMSRHQRTISKCRCPDINVRFQNGRLI